MSWGKYTKLAFLAHYLQNNTDFHYIFRIFFSVTILSMKAMITQHHITENEFGETESKEGHGEIREGRDKCVNKKKGRKTMGRS